jgi:hypothetical protein
MRNVSTSKIALGFKNGQVLIVDIPTETIVLRTQPIKLPLEDKEEEVDDHPYGGEYEDEEDSNCGNQEDT